MDMRRFWDFLVYGIAISGIVVLTRPGSQGPKLIQAIFGGLTDFAKGVSGQGLTYTATQSGPVKNPKLR